ncbi:SHOCT domain-containing protein [Bacillus sp. FJAT-49732]|uniref:SHOCT domain-containing protein n=1 Tax=Lederbergia citrisecunda TaxID=2833583 RepID=A0A942TR10_9BACI|nr:SHOCT domain-containing protein [Lederbergia citrisecunda]MBS4201758.1 SHOCT domain-containing protein [Lederbergia citrisecunda]
MHHWGYFHPFAFVFFLIIVGVFIMIWRGRGRKCYHPQNDALSILEARFAKGEISAEEFKEMKKTLNS